MPDTKTNSEWIEEFDKLIDNLPKRVNETPRGVVKAFITNLLSAKDAEKEQALAEQAKGLPKHMDSYPVGVSEWERHGRKYGYWDFFKKKILKEIK